MGDAISRTSDDDDDDDADADADADVDVEKLESMAARCLFGFSGVGVKWRALRLLLSSPPLDRRKRL